MGATIDVLQQIMYRIKDSFINIKQLYMNMINRKQLYTNQTSSSWEKINKMRHFYCHIADLNVAQKRN